MQTKEINLSVDSTISEEAKCHLMPCLIDHNDLRVKSREYFWPTIKPLQAGGDNDQGRATKHDKSTEVDSAKESVLVASFRGRPLQGSCVKLPDGHIGHVILKKAPTKGMKTKKHFETFTYWNWDEMPSDQDSVVKALDWIKVAKAIHNPID